MPVLTFSINQLWFTSLFCAKSNTLETTSPASPGAMQRDYEASLIYSIEKCPTNWNWSERCRSHPGFPFSIPSPNKISITLWNICYNGHWSGLLRCPIPTGAPSSSSIANRVGCAPRKQDAAFCSWSSQGRDQICSEQLSLNQKMPLYTYQQEDYLTMLFSEVFTVVNLLCNTWVMSWLLFCNCYEVLFITKG